LGGKTTGYTIAKGGWQAKSRAMVACSFDEFLYMDADCFPEVDPTYLFDSEPYKKFGAVFPPDKYKWTEEKYEPLEEYFGVPFIDEYEFEGGSALINKNKCMEALLLADKYNQNYEEVYPLTQGDKNTFHFAWRKTHTPYYMNSHRKYVRGVSLQHDYKGDLLFRHLTGIKFDITGKKRLTEEEFPHLNFVTNALVNRRSRD
jgi:alpha 1,2-mannosyltransferase